MDLHKAHQLEQLKWSEAVNRRNEEFAGKVKQINETIPRSSGAWHAARGKLKFERIVADMEDRLRIREELIGKCAELASAHQLHTFERQCHSTIDAQFQQAGRNFQADGIQALSSILAEAESMSYALKAAVSRKVRVMALETSQTAMEPKHQAAAETLHTSKNPRAVWVVHGRDERLRRGVFDFLRSIGLQPLEFSEARERTNQSSPYVGDILEAAFDYAQAVVVLLTPDDEARLRPDLQRATDPAYEKTLTGQARPNVLFEAGMALVSHRDRTVLVQIGEVRPFSDVIGRHIVHLDASTEKRQDLASRLQTAGCPVNLSGTDWHTAGDLAQATNPRAEIPIVGALHKELSAKPVSAKTEDPVLVHRRRQVEVQIQGLRCSDASCHSSG